MSFEGHLWTLRPFLAHKLRPLREPPSVAWATHVEDPTLGPLRLGGRLSTRPGARAALVVIHGLGGSSAAPYAIAAAQAALDGGLDVLRLDLRGADGEAPDFYNAGLTADLRAAIASEALARYETLFVLGFSLGGHLTLRHATEDLDPRVRAVVAVCPPVDLDLTATAFDRPAAWIYRSHVLGGLKAMYASVSARRAALPPGGPPLPSVAEARRIDRIRAWDDRIVAPRFGFRSAAHYYAESSVAPRLHRLAVPSLLIAAVADPMVPEATVRPALARRYPMLDVRWIETGGHVGFPPALDLGLGGATGLMPQIARWLRKAAAI